MEAVEIVDVAASATEAGVPVVASTVTVADLPVKAADTAIADPAMVALLPVATVAHVRVAAPVLPESQGRANAVVTDPGPQVAPVAMTASAHLAKGETRTNLTISRLKGGPVVGLLLYYCYLLCSFASNSW